MERHEQDTQEHSMGEGDTGETEGEAMGIPAKGFADPDDTEGLVIRFGQVVGRAVCAFCGVELAPNVRARVFLAHHYACVCDGCAERYVPGILNEVARYRTPEADDAEYRIDYSYGPPRWATHLRHYHCYQPYLDISWHRDPQDPEDDVDLPDMDYIDVREAEAQTNIQSVQVLIAPDAAPDKAARILRKIADAVEDVGFTVLERGLRDSDPVIISITR